MGSSEDRMFVTPDGQRVWFTFVLVSSLFLLWGFCNGMIDTMDKHFQDELGLSKAQSAWVQFAHFLGYFLMALPAGHLAVRWGYKGGIIAGLLLVAVGGFWFIPATWISDASKVGDVAPAIAFTAFLFGVCVIAAGLTFLETIANPYTTVLGSERHASTRINFAQSFCGLGMVFGPIVGGMFFYGVDEAGASTGSQTLYLPYVGVAITVLVIAAIFAITPMPDVQMKDHFHVDDATSSSDRSIWTHPHFVIAVLAQFCYVAAQAGIFSFMINYMTEETPTVPANWVTSLDTLASTVPDFMHSWFTGWTEVTQAGAVAISDRGAANLSSFGFLCFLFGRFAGTALFNAGVSSHALLGWFAVANVVACLLVAAKLGWWSAAAVFATYFFMSIMFPTIFALGIHGLGSRAKQASAYLVMAIMGGALLPKLMGAVADRYDMSLGYMVPATCFLVIAAYGFLWPRLAVHSK